MGEDAPGVGLYSPNPNFYLKNNPKCTIAQAKRFQESSIMNCTTQSTKSRDCFKSKRISGGPFSRARRRADLFYSSITPGPTDYSIFDPSKKSIHGICFNKEERKMFKDNKKTPGPAAYSPLLLFKKKFTTIPRVIVIIK